MFTRFVYYISGPMQFDYHTTSDVIEALGGNMAVARVLNASPQAVSNWRRFDTFPSNTYVALSAALRAIDKSAPPSLWAMKGATAETAA